VTDTNVFKLSQPGTFTDPLTEVLRKGARALLAQAVEAEVAALLSVHADKLTDDGHQRLVRHGHLPEREIMIGIGAVAVRCPRVRDRVGEGGERIRFSSAILPPYARRSKSLEVLIPILYLKGVSTGDFKEALIALLGKDAGGLSASTIGRLKDAWSDEHARWSKRDLSAKRYVYFWVDGIHAQARLEHEAQCLLVIKARIRAMGIRDRSTSFRSPWQNGYIERLIGSIRRECTDHLIVFNAEHLRRILAKYAAYYNEGRTHVSLGKDAPCRRSIERFGDIIAYPILGGLHHRYARI
jgi:Transposase, Mutator family